MPIKNRSFTLIELIMVITIIGILAAIAIPKFISLRRDAKRAQCQGSIAAIQSVISNYTSNAALYNATSNGAQYPPNISSLANYFADGIPPSPGWNKVNTGYTMKTPTWDDFYNPATGAMDQNAACNLSVF